MMQWAMPACMASSPPAHRLLEDRSGVVVQGLEEVIVRNATEIYQVRQWS